MFEDAMKIDDLIDHLMELRERLGDNVPVTVLVHNYPENIVYPIKDVAGNIMNLEEAPNTKTIMLSTAIFQVDKEVIIHGTKATPNNDLD